MIIQSFHFCFISCIVLTFYCEFDRVAITSSGYSGSGSLFASSTALNWFDASDDSQAEASFIAELSLLGATNI